MYKTENISNKMWQKIICYTNGEYDVTVFKTSFDYKSI
jgi:hypothetical protein